MSKVPEPTKNPHSEKDEPQEWLAWSQGYVAGATDVAKVVAAYLRGEFTMDALRKEK